MPQPPVILGKSAAPRSPRASRWTPATLGDVAPMLIVAGCALSIVGWTDVALLYWPQQFGQPEWEFGIIASTFDILPVALTGMLLLGVGLRARGTAPLLTRAGAIACLLVAVACLVLLVIFTLDIPVAWRAMNGAAPAAQGAAARPNPVVIAGIKRGVAKAFVFGLGYCAAFGLLGVMLWRAAGTTQLARAEG